MFTNKYTKKFTHKYLPQELWTLLLVTIYLVSMLLPAKALFAADAEPLCPVKSGESVSVAAAVPPSNQPVKIPKEEVDRATFVAIWNDNLEMANRVVGLYYALLMNNASEADMEYELEWDVLTQQLQDLVDSTRIDVTSPFAYDELLHKAIDLTLARPELAHLAPQAWKELAEVNSQDSSLYPYYGDVASQVSTSAWRYSQAARMLAASSDILSRAYGCGQMNPDYAEAFNEQFSERLNAGITDDAMEILEKNLEANFPTQLRGRIAADGTITISLDELKALTADEFGKLHTTIDEIRGTLVEMDAQQLVLVNYVKNEQLKAKQQEDAKKKAAAYQAKLDAAKASVSILSIVTGQIDKKLGKDVATLGNSTIQIADSLNGWIKATSGLKGLEKASSLSTVVMTGNVLGAVMNIVALFGEDKPTPEQLILQEIGKLRQQVDQLRKQMHNRFDRIDAGLNAIYTSMNDRFNQIDITLGRIDGNILDIQQTLYSLDLKLSQIERNNFELINAVGRRELLTAINLNLNYEENTGEQMPYDPDFIQFANLLHSWGTIVAYDPGSAGPTQRDFSDGKVYEELTKYPLDINLNYLNGWLIANGLPALTDKFLASSRDWLFASRAYAQLGIEQPQHMARIGEGRQAKLDQVGFELDSAIEKISTVQTENGPIGNTLLFSSVITYYQNKLGPLNSAIEQAENGYINDLRVNTLQRNEPFNLFGGPRQALSYVTPEVSTLTCGNSPTHGPRPIASNLKALIPNFDLFNMADYLRVGTFAGCLTDEWQDLQQYSEDDPTRPWDPPTYYWAGEHKAILTIYFDNVPLMRQTIDEGWTRMDFYLPDVWTKDSWDFEGGYKEKFDALTTADQPSAEMLAQQAELVKTVNAKVEGALAGLQKQMYSKIAHDLTAGSLKDKAVEVGGGKELLSAFTTLGLSRAVAEDEFLHAFLYGNQRLVDHNSVVQSYALSLTNPITGTGLLVNARSAIMKTANERLAVFGEIIGDYLAAIGEEEHVEEADFIANTRRALEMTMLVAAVSVEEPPVTPQPTSTPDPSATPDPTGEPPLTPVPTETPTGPSGSDAKQIYLPTLGR